MISEDNGDGIEKDLTPSQKILFGDSKVLLLATRKKVAVTERVKFTENLNKLFPKANVVFENSNQKPFNFAELLSRPEMATIPHTQVMFKELNKGKLPIN